MAGSAYGPVSAPISLPPPLSIGSQFSPGEQALGLKAIYAACRTLYPDQPTPLQVTAVRKYWMGGMDPLDFINMYLNPGSSDLQSPAHWHYVTNGLSDLYGDSRLHSQCASIDEPSGFGFELTLRLLKEPSETSPPTWPAHLLQSIARYIFHSQAQLMVGDHIPWSSPLDKQSRPTHCPTYAPDSPPRPDYQSAQSVALAAAAAATAASFLATNDAKCDRARFLSDPSTYASMISAALSAVSSASTFDSATTSAAFSKHSSAWRLAASRSHSHDGSRIRHMLVVEDPQLKKIFTPYGYVHFLQLVGLCDEELRLVQRWTGKHVMELMIRLPETGGGLLVTDMNRTASLFDLDETLEEFVNKQLLLDGSNLSGVTTHYFAWSAISPSFLVEPIPGELEVQRRHLTVQSDSTPLPDPATSVLQPKSRGSSQRRSVGTRETACLPTDLSMPRSSQLFRSISPVAMETDESATTSEVKNVRYDDDFVDVVGDSDHSSLSDSNTHRTDLRKEKYRTTSATHTAQISSGADANHPLSAPGDFSSWCTRLNKSFSTANTMHRNASTSLSSNSATEHNDSSQGTPFHTDSAELSYTISGPLGFKNFTADCSLPQVSCMPFGHCDYKCANTPGSTGEGSAPCTPLAHLSLSPASLDLMPTHVIDCLDVQLCRDAGEILPLAVNGRLRHRRHFTFLNANFPDHAITLVPTGVTGAFVSDETPYVARGPWLQILIPDDFLDSLEHQLSAIPCTEDSLLPLVFRWPERKLRICLVDSTQNQLRTSVHSPQHALTNHHSLLSRSTVPNLTDSSRDRNEVASAPHYLMPCASRSANFISAPENSAPASLFPYISPGYIPTPAMLTALFNMAPGSHSSDFSPCQEPVRNSSVFRNTASRPGQSTTNFRSDNHYASGENGSASQFPPCDATTYWAQMFSKFLQSKSATNTPLPLPPTSAFTSETMYQQGLLPSTATINSNFISSTT